MDKPTIEIIYFFDSIYLFKIVLLSSLYYTKIYIKLVYFVNKPSELFYSIA